MLNSEPASYHTGRGIARVVLNTLDPPDALDHKVARQLGLRLDRTRDDPESDAVTRHGTARTARLHAIARA